MPEQLLIVRKSICPRKYCYDSHSSYSSYRSYSLGGMSLLLALLLVRIWKRRPLLRY